MPFPTSEICPWHKDASVDKDKIFELKERVAEFYFEKESKLIAIPNQITLPKKPHILEKDETDDKKKNINSVYIDKYYEDTLHLAITEQFSEQKQGSKRENS